MTNTIAHIGAKEARISFRGDGKRGGRAMGIVRNRNSHSLVGPRVDELQSFVLKLHCVIGFSTAQSVRTICFVNGGCD